MSLSSSRLLSKLSLTPVSSSQHMEEQLQSNAATAVEEASIQIKPDSQSPNHDEIALVHDSHVYLEEEVESACSTPFVSAPSSPAFGQPISCGGYFYSAPASPMHFGISSTSMHSEVSGSSSYEFEFSARLGISGTASGGSMSSADELFLNGQIRPMKLSSHLQRPQTLEPLLDLDESEGDGIDDETEVIGRGRDVKWRDRSMRRRTRSMSPLRTPAFQWDDYASEKTAEITEAGAVSEALESKHEEEVFGETTPSMSASSSRSSSASRSSKRWISLKDFLYRSKSEGRNNGHKFWSSISFSPVKDRKGSSDKASSTTLPSELNTSESSTDSRKVKQADMNRNKKGGIPAGRKATNGVTSRMRTKLSPHEVHYKASRAQAEESRKKTFLPYRQGLLGCLGFSSKGYGAMNGFARTLKPVSSR